MARHVDLVKNEWLAGMQIRLVSVVDTGGGFRLADVTPGWEDLLTRETVGDDGYPTFVTKEPLEALPRMFHSEYVFATEAHDEAQCPFRFGPVLAMQSPTVESQVSPPLPWPGGVAVDRWR